MCAMILLALQFVMGFTQQDSEILNNEVVLQLHKAGLGTKVILSMIETSPSRFDVSPTGVIVLTEAGLSDEVIAAMVKAATSETAVGAPTDPNDPFSPHSPGIYIYTKDREGNPRMNKINPTSYTQKKRVVRGALVSPTALLKRNTKKSSRAPTPEQK